MKPDAARRQLILAGAALLLAPMPGRARAAPPPFTGWPGTQVRFATVPQARAMLATEDTWMAATSPLNRQLLMRSPEPVSWEAFKAWNADAARAWTPTQLAHWQRTLQAVAPAVAALRLPLPPEIWLVSTNGQESAGAPYTRGNFIALPQVDGADAPPDEALLLHELWHVVSRHDPALATRLYAELGFQPMAPLQVPEAWRAIVLANPDAPDNRHAMRLTLDGSDRRPWVTPVLVSGRSEVQPGDTVFTVLQVRLLEVLPGEGGAPSTAVLRDGQPVWHPVRGPHDYLRQLGGNTGYVLHPEEALADNFVLLALQLPARNPGLIGRLRAVLDRRPS